MPTQVISQDERGWRFDCDCDGVFASDAWPSEAMATVRAALHEREHDTGELMPSEQVTLAGLYGTVTADLAVSWDVEADEAATSMELSRRFFGDGYLQAADSSSLRSPSTAITVACWVRYHDDSDSGPAYSALVFKVHGTTSPFLSYAIQQQTEDFKLRFRISNGTTLYNTALTDTLPAEEWLFVAGTWTSGGKLTLRVWDLGGDLIDTAESDGNVTATIGYTDGPLRIAVNELASGADADLQGVLVHNAVLSDQQLEDWRDDGIIPAVSAGAWALDSELDVSGHGNHLTLVGPDEVVSGPHDNTAPEISAVTATVGSESTVVTWDTNEQATSRVDFGLTASYGGSLTSPGYNTAHEVALTGLSAETTYHYRVRSTDAAGNETVGGDRTFVTEAAAAPAAPVLTAQGLPGSIRLTWSSVPDADEYSILRALSELGSYTELEDEIVGTQYNDDTVTPGTPYWYVGKAHNESGASADSDPVTATAPEEDSSATGSWEEMVAAREVAYHAQQGNYWPGADAWYEANTGHEANGIEVGDLTPGSLTSTHDGQVFEGIIGGPANWRHNNVKYINCRIVNNGSYAAYPTPVWGSPFTGIEFINCTFAATPARDIGCIINNYRNGPSVFLDHCNLFGWSSGFMGYGGIRAEYCWVHDFVTSSVEGAHVTSGNCRGPWVQLYRCYGTSGGSGIFNAYFDYQDVSNSSIIECLMNGSSPTASPSYCTNMKNGDYGPGTRNFKLIGNHWGDAHSNPEFFYGCLSSANVPWGSNGNERSGNSWFADGSPCGNMA